MRINIKQTVKDYQGRDMKTADEETIKKDGKEIKVKKERDLLLRDAINLAVNGIILNAQGQALPSKPEEKGRIYQLSTKIWNTKKDVKFTAEEITFIKKRAKEVSNITPLVCGRICDILEGKSEPKKD